MFTFFRKYQRFIYLIVTAVIILSFSFFGTYSAITSGKGDDPVVFTTVAGKKITRSQFNDYVHFFSMDANECEGRSGNCLNDGVIDKDIISTPIGEALVKRFAQEFAGEWNSRFKREKQFQPYRHPQAPFISAEQVWSYFAPDIKTALEAFQEQTDWSAVDFYNKKTALYLSEKKFPSAYLRQLLQYQQKQFEWVEPDAALEGRQLSLFGYQQLSDWFGQSFVEKSAEFIIQMAAKARLMGVSVSRGEVLASLHKNVQSAAKRYGDSMKMSPDELMKRTLLSLGMDESRIIKIWEDVLLVRKSLLDIPRKIILSGEAFSDRLQSEAQSVSLDVFQLQPSLRLGSFRDLLKVELWLDAVLKKEKSPSLIPGSDFRSCDEVVASFPEFVERRFVLSVAEVDTTKLASQMRIKDIWTWQNDHWEELCKEIPSLNAVVSSDREARFRTLEELAPQLRIKADEVAKERILSSRPEWITQGLDAAKPETKVFGLRLQGGAFPFEGIKDRKALLLELTKAPIAECNPVLCRYTQDGKHFYKISVLDRKTADELVSLPDLLADGTLDAVLDRILEAAYERVRSEKPSEFKRENGSWKAFSEVKDAVGELYFAPLLKRLDQAVREWREINSSYCQWDNLKTARVAVRFLPLLEEKIKCIEKEGEDAGTVTLPYQQTDKESMTLESRPLKDLFSLVLLSEKIKRSDLKEKPMFKEAFSLEKDFWMTPKYSQNLGTFVAKVKNLSQEEYQGSMRKMIYDLQDELGEEIITAKAQEYVREFFPNEDK